jgi:hypothetical protein
MNRIDQGNSLPQGGIVGGVCPLVDVSLASSDKASQCSPRIFSPKGDEMKLSSSAASLATESSRSLDSPAISVDSGPFWAPIQNAFDKIVDAVKRSLHVGSPGESPVSDGNSPPLASPSAASPVSTTPPLDSTPQHEVPLEIEGRPASSKGLLESFINHERHTDKLSLEDRRNLVIRGQIILNALQDAKPVPENSTSIFNLEKMELLCPAVWQAFGKTCTVPYSVMRQFGVFAQADPEHTLKRQLMLGDLISVIWAIYHEAHCKGIPIEGGSFNIVGESRRLLWEYLLSYVLFAAQVDSIEALPSAWGSNLAYSRTGAAWWGGAKSSHYPQETQIQIGIDARFASNGWTLPVFPFQKTHLLIGSIMAGDDTVVFIKAEDSGLGDMSSLLAHACSFLAHQTSTHSEKKLPATFVQDAESLWKMISSEKLPKEVRKIKSELDLLLTTDLSVEKQAVIQELSQLIFHCFSKEHIDIRKGSEVILELPTAASDPV